MPPDTPEVNPLPRVKNLLHKKSVRQRFTYKFSAGCLCVSVKEKGLAQVWWPKGQLDANITFLHLLLLLLMKISEHANIYNIYLCNIYKGCKQGGSSFAYTQRP